MKKCHVSHLNKEDTDSVFDIFQISLDLMCINKNCTKHHIINLFSI